MVENNKGAVNAIAKELIKAVDELKKRYNASIRIERC